MKQVTIEDMKKGIKENPLTQKYLEMGIEEYGLTEEEALDCMLEAYFNRDKNEIVNGLVKRLEER